jgi:hypothetical protein
MKQSEPVTDLIGQTGEKNRHGSWHPNWDSHSKPPHTKWQLNSELQCSVHCGSGRQFLLECEVYSKNSQHIVIGHPKALPPVSVWRREGTGSTQFCRFTSCHVWEHHTLQNAAVRRKKVLLQFHSFMLKGDLLKTSIKKIHNYTNNTDSMVAQ